MITFTEARQIVADDMGPKWSPALGTFMVADYGRESASEWQVIVGARETLVDNVPGFANLGAPLVFVNKSTGAIVRRGMLPARSMVAAMRDVAATTEGPA